MSNAHRIRPLGHTDQGGRPDGVQVMVAGGHAYVGHMFSKGFSVIDVRDPSQPLFVKHIPSPPNSAFLMPLMVVMSNRTLSSNMPTWPA